MNLNSQEFHDKYSNMLKQKVKVILNSEYVINGHFNDEFYEDNSILINNGTLVTIKIEAIKSIELFEEK